ncbi:hypothetical protein Tco_0956008 [Tanacetum coccineum]|uniref:Retrovirus-related Pol polyprotein from transposon TNT 1-94 n=1 Tax=Tanacetum coccineum TaxID=301880 RepID=A0ABQ5E8T6_9ASTR
METCDPVGTPMEIKDKLDLHHNGTPVDAMKYHSMIGALMYLTSSRPNIVHATCLCARYQTKPTEKLLKEISDADYAGCKDTFKSTSGGAQLLGKKLVSWSSKKQDCTTLSTAEVEYVSLSACCAQVLWMRTQLTDYGFQFNKIPIYCDSKSAIAISCNLVQHSRTKHIVVRYHFIKEHVEKGMIELYFVKMDYQLANMFTQALPPERFNYLVRRLSMRSLSPQELERFGDQFLKLSSDSSLVSTVKDSTDTDVLVSVIPKTTVLPPIPEIVTETLVSTAVFSSQVIPIISFVQQTTTLIPTRLTDAPTVTTAILESNALTAVELRVAKLEKDVSKLKTVDHSSEALAVLQSYVPTVHLPELTKKPTLTTEQEYEKNPSDILKIKKEQAEKQQMPKFTVKSTDKAALEEYNLKSALYQSMHANKSFNRNPANHRLYHALMESLIEDKNIMDKGATNIVKYHKRKHDDDEDDDDEDPLAGPNQGKKTKRRRTKEFESTKKPSTTKETPKGKAPYKGSKTGKSALAKEPVEEPNAEVIMDDAGNDVVVLDQPEQPWFNQMVSDSKYPLTFNDLMETPIDFSKYACFNAFTDKLDWNNPEGDRYPFNLSKPLPLYGPPGHQTVVVDYFFNNDLEYLKTSDPDVTYTTSITKTKVARYEIKGIEDMVNKFSKHNVYSNKVILGVKSVSVKKLNGYDHLEEIVVKRSYQQLHKFKEGDFVDLHLNDIEDMLLLAVQHKLFHLDGSDIVNFIVALRMFTRSLILKRRVEDLQLGVETASCGTETLEPKDRIPRWTMFVFQRSEDVSMKALTSSSEKVKILKEQLGLDEAFNYKEEIDINSTLQRHQRVLKDSLGVKSQRATSDVFKLKTSSRKSKIT